MATTRISVSFEGASQQEVLQKIQEYMQQVGVSTGVASVGAEDFPDEVKKLYPKYRSNKFSAVMLSVIFEHSKSNKIDVYDLAEKMQKLFPLVLKSEGYDKYEEITTGTVLAGNFLKQSKLVDFQKELGPDGYPRRVYWRA
jgi:hypothetical protein